MTESLTQDQIREQAAHWLVRLDEAPSAEVLAEFNAWHAADARHAQLFEQLQQLWQSFSPPPKARRRRAHLMGAALVLPAAIAVGQWLPVQSWMAPATQATASLPARLIFHDRPLPEVLAEIDRHRRGVIWASDAQLQTLRFTGVLPAQDSDAALALLQAALPIRIETYSKYLVQVRQR
ncbi:FecR family protein [Pseudomonas frederiksbergensis]|jgi:ferric-dicitrate binding protein FerR (iron transport regulator)|uniref:FecR N-terminal domain-containing protein n=1 Tax=Pseudomonas frederiksbergensis TaxID=104087 RepID=A0A423JH17_9PSED|nr:DUF4880 domain-containing protein [Pseudomonas frederiksbergensis]RON37000.1 hypothetical protein BK661_01145 [Pseudomonas frederiksbergensis]